ncbi:cytochrome d ubiquinol oxidase subunit II [Streptosporangium sp. NPDC000396]|uniref:cytochrome d ubiquinol oxidase subunit II n=1 Tax=Streptosporangium sp. NPDC000396 TaxID=3366185 RepID=UPI003698FBA1
MELLWPTLLGVLFAGYFVVDGFDIGTGLLLRRIGRTEAERRALITSIGPFFLGNEVWLVAVGGVLTGAFPLLKDRVLGGLYLLVVAGLLIWVLRDASIWFRSRKESARWRSGWDRSLTVTSAAFAVFWGLVIGALLGGLPPAGEAGTAGPWELTGAYSLLWAGVMVVLFAAHGAVFLTVRLPADLVTSAEATAARLLRPAAGLLGFAVLTGLVFVVPWEPGRSLPVGVIGASAVAALWFASGSVTGRRYGRALALSAFAVASPALMIGFRLAPGLPDATADAASLRVLGGFTLGVLPLLVAMQVGMWWAFRRRVDARTVVFF